MFFFRSCDVRTVLSDRACNTHCAHLRLVPPSHPIGLLVSGLGTCSQGHRHPPRSPVGHTQWRVPPLPASSLCVLTSACFFLLGCSPCLKSVFWPRLPSCAAFVHTCLHRWQASTPSSRAQVLLSKPTLPPLRLCCASQLGNHAAVTVWLCQGQGKITSGVYFPFLWDFLPSTEEPLCLEAWNFPRARALLGKYSLDATGHPHSESFVYRPELGSAQLPDSALLSTPSLAPCLSVWRSLGRGLGEQGTREALSSTAREEKQCKGLSGELGTP